MSSASLRSDARSQSSVDIWISETLSASMSAAQKGKSVQDLAEYTSVESEPCGDAGLVD